MFTGDASGDFLYPALYRAGFANRPKSAAREDGLALCGLFISAVCRCVPPENRPAPQEIANCLPYLEEEIHLLRELRVFVALGRTAYDALLQMLTGSDFNALGHLAVAGNGSLEKPPPFAHGLQWEIRRRGERNSAPLWMAASYHPSRQNTQTGRLTRAMFDRVWRAARKRAFPEK
jgi:uracil-DNA glycosylase